MPKSKSNIKEQIKKPETKRLIIIFAISAAILLLACAVVFFPKPQDEMTLDGVYSLSVSGIGSSYYSFDSDGTGTLNYTLAETGEKVSMDFTYSINSSGDEITFVWEESGESSSHTFATGSQDGKELIRINGENYYKN